jgi:hypothetical protein
MKDWLCGALLCLVLLWCGAAWGQSPDPSEGALWLEQWNRERIAINHTGMSVLLGWSVLNLGGGLAGGFTSEGRWRAFHQMNAGWNLINLGIAAYALWDMSGQDPASFTALQGLAAGEKMEKVLLLNAGLDVAYVTAGLWLWRSGTQRRSPRRQGFGQSVLVQGTFLAVFDLALWWFNHGHDQSLYMKMGAARGGASLMLEVPW